MALLRLTSSFSAAPVVLAACSAVVAVAPLGAVTTEAKRSFDLPRGNAATTLRQFAAASGRSLVYVSDKVRGETTNPVRGEFTPREALERMLAGSALEAAEDAATGALVVSRKRTAESKPHTGEVGSVSDPQPKPKSNSMNSPRTLFAVFLGLILGPNSATLAADAPFGTIEGRVQNEYTGRYLGNARVSMKGTNLQAYSDDAGGFRIANVPAGAVVLEVYYTGLEAQEIPLTVAPGQSLRRDVNLKPPGQEVVRLNPYEVEATRITDQAVIAVNQQRFAPNIQSVVAVGDLSEHADDNPGEFLKFLAGMAGNAGSRAMDALSIRGFPAQFTRVTMDGANMASTADNYRNMNFSGSLTIENLARVELTKVPTPSMRADTMSGSVNLVTRSAFESVRPHFDYQVNICGDHEHVSLKPEPLGLEGNNYYIRPTTSFAYTKPVSDKFGFVVSGSFQSRWTPQDIYTPGHTYANATFGSSVEKPVLTSANYTSAGGIGERAAAALSADWRVGPQSVLSGMIQPYTQKIWNISYIMNHSTGTTATPTIAGGVTGSFGDTFTDGATGRGSARFSNNFTYNGRAGYRSNVRYKFNSDNWKIDGQAGYSAARNWRRGPDKGIVTNVGVNETIPLRVEFLNVDPITGPGQIRVFDNANNEINTHDPSYHKIMAVTTVTSGPLDNRDEVLTTSLDIKRVLSFLPFPSSVQVGGTRTLQEFDRRAQSYTWTYNGPGRDQSALPYVASFPKLRWDPYPTPAPVVSPFKLVSAWKENPSLLTQTPAQAATTEQYRRTNSEFIKEKTEALYFQYEARLFKNQLHVLTGVRWEKTTDDGQGALNTPDDVYVRRADGSFALTSTGARIRKPEAGTSGSMEQVNLTWHERASHAHRSYDDFYPSLHLTYNVTEKFLARAAYAKTYGRPNFTNIIPNTVINENANSDGEVTGGLLTVRNPGLRPWTADNFDVSLEYYTDQGGAFVVGAFRKDVRDFFGSVDREATPQELADAGVDPNAPNWVVRTTDNVGNARINGFELSGNQSLSPLDERLGGWGKNFRVFANITKLQLKGNRAADFNSFLPKCINYGVEFNRRSVAASIKANYRSEQTISALAALGPDGLSYWRFRTHIDVNCSYSFRPNLSVFVNIRNITNRQFIQLKEGGGLPAYARLVGITNYGVPWNLGIKGSF